MGLLDDPSFGALLRQWRRVRRISQLSLAHEARISPRHLSFLETGRSRPSREMVQIIGGALGLALSDQNALLLAAGFAPAFAQRPFAAADLESVRKAFNFMLRQQEPFPAIVVDGGWNVLMRNRASERLIALFFPVPMAKDLAANAMRNVFHLDGLRRFIINWEEFAGGLIQSLHREAITNPPAAKLRDELLAYPAVPAQWSIADPTAAPPPFLPLRLVKGELSFAFFTTITILAMPRDVTLEHLRIECFHPADTETERAARRLAADNSTIGASSAL